MLIHIELGNKGIPNGLDNEKRTNNKQRCVQDDKRAKKRSDKEGCTKLRETNDRMHLLVLG
jgi:hypothetical protein